MQCSSGAVYSLLPPENATGNYVKVVQRLPVRIRFKRGQVGNGSPRHVCRAEGLVAMMRRSSEISCTPARNKLYCAPMR